MTDDDLDGAVVARVRARLGLLRREFEAGERQLAELERQRTQVTETMLRISGAIQVLDEVLGGKAPESRGPDNDRQPAEASISAAEPAS